VGQQNIPLTLQVFRSVQLAGISLSRVSSTAGIHWRRPAISGLPALCVGAALRPDRGQRLPGHGNGLAGRTHNRRADPARGARLFPIR